MKAKGLTWYPQTTEERRRVQEISDAEGKLAETRVLSMAVRAFSKLYKEDWRKAMELARPEAK